MKKLRTRIIFLLFAAVLPIMVAFQSISAFNTWRSLRDASLYYIQRLAQEKALSLSAELSRAARSAVTMADALASTHDTGNAGRRSPQLLFQSTLQRQEEIFAAWALFEPDAWDGRDAAFRGRDGYDATGGYSPWVYRSPEGLKTKTAFWGEEFYEKDYYAGARAAGKPVVVEPYADDDESATLMTTISVPLVDPAGGFYGVLGLDLSLAALSDKTTAGTTAEGGGWVALVSPGGAILGHSNHALVTKPFSEVEGAENAELLLPAAVDATGAATATEGHWDTAATVTAPPRINSLSTGALCYATAADVDIGGLASWRLIVAVPVVRVEKAASAAATGQGAGMGALLLLLLVSALWVSSTITKPITAIAAAYGRMAGGDFSGHLDIKRRDELGSLARGFNEVGSSVSEIVRSVRRSTRELEGEALELLGATAETEKAIGRIAQATAQLRELATNQDERTRNSSRDIMAIAGDVDGLNAQVDEQWQAIEHSRNSVASLAERIAASGRAMEGMESAFAQLQASAEGGATTIAGVRELSEEVLRKSGSLAEASDVISAIAERTNLLAMNAAIEAAHAGEAGKGFAVVADEVRTLAESTTERSGEVQETLREVNETVAAMRQRADEAESAFGRMRLLIGDAAGLEETMRASMAEERREGERVVAELDHMESISRRVRIGAEAIRKAARSLGDGVADIERSGGELRELSADVEREADGLHAIAAQLRASAERNGGLADSVQEETARFKIAED